MWCKNPESSVTPTPVPFPFRQSATIQVPQQGQGWVRKKQPLSTLWTTENSPPISTCLISVVSILLPVKTCRGLCSKIQTTERTDQCYIDNLTPTVAWTSLDLSLRSLVTHLKAFLKETLIILFIKLHQKNISKITQIFPRYCDGLPCV